jgi:hypothetical protein
MTGITGVFLTIAEGVLLDFNHTDAEYSESVPRTQLHDRHAGDLSEPELIFFAFWITVRLPSGAAVCRRPRSAGDSALRCSARHLCPEPHPATGLPQPDATFFTADEFDRHPGALLISWIERLLPPAR